MAQPFISICVPVYNGEVYLRECLDSCLAQNYTNFEILVCDDGSTDGSAALLREYQTKHPQLRYYRNEKNLGLVGNWNRCIELAKGEWIKLVFQDDYLHQACLKEFVKHIEPDTQLLVSKRHFVLPQDAGEDVKTYYASTVRTLETTCGLKTRYTPKEISRAAIQHIGMNFIAEPSLSLFRKSVVNQVGKFEPVLKQICDLEFMLRVASRYGLTYLPQDLCYFRIHNASTTSTNVSNNYFDLKYIEPVLFAWLLKFSGGFQYLRKQLTVWQQAKLHLYFLVKCYKAGRENRQIQANHKVFDPLETQFKAIQAASLGSWYIRLLNKFI